MLQLTLNRVTKVIIFSRIASNYKRNLATLSVVSPRAATGSHIDRYRPALALVQVILQFDHAE